MTFQTLDELLAFYERFYEQVAADRLRETTTTLLLRADEIDDDIGDVVDGCRAQNADAMATLQAETRREFETMPLRFPSR